MSTILYRAIAVGVIVAALLAACSLPASAVAPPAHDVNGAGAPVAGWVELAPNEAHYFKFAYNFDNTDEDSEPPEALVVLHEANDSRAVGFTVETSNSLAWPEYDEEGEFCGPFGVGAPVSLATHTNDLSPAERARVQASADEHGMVQDWSTLIWSGSAGGDELFYVIVRNSTNAPQVYALSITGEGVAS